MTATLFDRSCDASHEVTSRDKTARADIAHETGQRRALSRKREKERTAFMATARPKARFGLVRPLCRILLLNISLVALELVRRQTVEIDPGRVADLVGGRRLAFLAGEVMPNLIVEFAVERIVRDLQVALLHVVKERVDRHGTSLARIGLEV